jgi:hypothetical protein
LLGIKTRDNSKERNYMVTSNISGQKELGIMMLDTRFPRIRGDIGNPSSYSFPVRMKIIKGVTVHRVVMDGDSSLLGPLIETAKELEAQGVCAITSSCGFLAPFQEAVSKAVHVPVFLSSLIQIPLVYLMTQRRVGIITGHDKSLTHRHLEAAGVTKNIPLAIGGLQDKPAYSAILEDEIYLDQEKLQQEMLEVADELLSQHPDIGAFVFECHNLAPYAPAVVNRTHRPVFDIISLAEWIYYSNVKRVFSTVGP